MLPPKLRVLYERIAFDLMVFTTYNFQLSTDKSLMVNGRIDPSPPTSAVNKLVNSEALPEASQQPPA